MKVNSRHTLIRPRVAYKNKKIFHLYLIVGNQAQKPKNNIYKITTILKQQLQQQDNAGRFYLNTNGTIDVKTFNKINKKFCDKNIKKRKKAQTFSFLF